MIQVKNAVARESPSALNVEGWYFTWWQQDAQRERPQHADQHRGLHAIGLQDRNEDVSQILLSRTVAGECMLPSVTVVAALLHDDP